MKGFDVYCAYLALQRHFTLDRFDYFKYNGGVKVNPSTFEKRNDRLAFAKLSKDDDFERIILANFVYGPSTFIMDIASKQGMDVYWTWLRRIESLPYAFKQELGYIQGSIVNTLKVYNGQHPALLKMYAQEQVSLETLMIMLDLSGCLEQWNTKIIDPVFWPSIAFKIKKYRGFLDYDSSKMKAILLGVLDDRR